MYILLDVISRLGNNMDQKKNEPIDGEKKLDNSMKKIQDGFEITECTKPCRQILMLRYPLE